MSAFTFVNTQKDDENGIQKAQLLSIFKQAISLNAIVGPAEQTGTNYKRVIR